MDRMQLLENAYQNMHAYTKHSDGWRPGLVDLAVYHSLIGMYEDDTEDTEYTWNDTPDHVMEAISKSNYIFDLEFGWEDLLEAIRDYLVENNFIKHIDDVDEEEEE